MQLCVQYLRDSVQYQLALEAVVASVSCYYFSSGAYSNPNLMSLECALHLHHNDDFLAMDIISLVYPRLASYPVQSAFEHFLFSFIVLVSCRTCSLS